MYFKYYPMETNMPAIRKSDFVRIVELHDSAGGQQGFLLVPWDKEGVCQIIDASISRLVGLLCDDTENVLWRIQKAQKKENYQIGPVWNLMDYDDPWYDGLKYYDTQAEANAEMGKIAAAIMRGDRLYDLTEEAGEDG